MNSYMILFIIAAYFAVLLLIAWITGRNNSNEAFFLGNRKSPWYIVSIGMVGTSLSGVTFVSVPGMVRAIDMTYMQTVLGFFVGYIIIAKVLLPLYYKLQLTSIYSYLDDRIGRRGYKTGASFFLLSKIVGAAARLYLVVLILQRLEHPIRRDRYPQYPAGMAIYVPERYQDDHLDRYVAGPLSRGNVDRDHLAGEGQDGTGFRGYGADLGGKSSFPDLRVWRLA